LVFLRRGAPVTEPHYSRTLDQTLLFVDRMDYFDKRPQLFQLLFGILSGLLVVVAAIDVYMFGKSPSDENIFQDPPSNVCFVVTALAERFDRQLKSWVPDSIRIGDLPTELNGKKFDSLQQAEDYVSGLPESSFITIRLMRPDENQYYLYRLPKSAIAFDKVQELQPTAWVTNVTEGGASDRAGMKVGDLITRINGQTFLNVNEADQILRSGQIGKATDYDVLRKGTLITLHVTLASFGLQFAFLVFIVSGIVCMAAGIFLGVARPGYVAARILGLLLLLLGYFMTIIVVNRGLEPVILKTIRQLTSPFSLVTSFALFLHVCHYFPKDRPDLLRRKWIRIGGYILAGTGFIAILVLPGWGQVAAIIANGLYAFLLPVFYRKQCPPEYRKMNRSVKWAGMTIGVASIAFGFLVPRLDGHDILRWLTVYGIVLLAFPISYLYTINRYRLMNLTLRMRRNVQYSFVSVLWTVFAVVFVMAVMSWLVQAHLNLPYIRITGQSVEVVGTPPTPTEQAMMEKGFLMALAIGATLLLARVYKAGSRFLARKFHRARYDYRRAANELADVMSTTLNMTQLARGIVEKLAMLMQLKKAGLLFFRNQSVCCCTEAHGFDGTSWEKFCITIDEELVDGLRHLSGETSVEYLPARLKERFRQQEFHYVIPIRSKEKLVGAMLIGEKMSEAPFQHEDLEFLAAVAKQASVAIENAFLHEELTEQERLKHELAIARRIQLESLPQSTPNIGGLEISGISIPALEVGGDFFDYLNGSLSKLTVIVGDVSGKGTSAALYMSKVQGILRSLHGFGLAPRELFIRANNLLCNDLEKRSFITAMGAAFDTDKKRLVLARAGHLPLFHYKAATKKVEKITPKGLGLGLSPEHLFANELEERPINYGVGDVFVFVTDGITEGQRQTRDEFGEDRLLALLETTSSACAEAIRDRVIDEVRDFAGDANQHDDQTVVVVKSVEG
jgi:serine phosphatase RsbU (regulator of sigma subunit)